MVRLKGHNIRPSEEDCFGSDGHTFWCTCWQSQWSNDLIRKGERPSEEDCLYGEGVVIPSGVYVGRRSGRKDTLKG